MDKKLILRRIEFGASIAAVIMGVILIVGGNMLGVWIVGFAIWGFVSSLKRIRNERKRT